MTTITTMTRIKEVGVLRDTARAPQPPTNQPTGHQISWQGLYVPKKAYFGAKLAVFGPNILGGSKSSGTHISKKHLGASFALFYWSGMAPNGSERPVLGPKWPKMHIRFLLLDPGFCQWAVCSPRKDGPFCTFGSIFRLFVSEKRPFSERKRMGNAPKSLPPPHYGAPSAASNSPSTLSERARWLQLLQLLQWPQWLHWLQWVTDTWGITTPKGQRLNPRGWAKSS